ncbi:helix-turn-helix domain-containing protein [Halovenus halobia]|uniref:helix-turn-helix domain-containing protein n=1 Tax=Halovenus halobia TaxID=3396622 RepID=UPI003F555B53
MARICAELRLEANVSPLSTLPESVGPVTPLALVLLDFILTGSTPPGDSGLAKLVEENKFSPGHRSEEPTENNHQEQYEWLSDEVQSVTEVYAEDGDLHLTLTVENRERLRDLIAGIERRHGTTSIKRLTEVSEYDGPTSDQSNQHRQTPALLEQENKRAGLPQELRQRLTERQYEVLTVAYENGYFEYPRDSNAEAVAEELGITASTFTEHLSTAQSKLMGELLEPAEQSFDQ